jgi:hypothetical protein
MKSAEEWANALNEALPLLTKPVPVNCVEFIVKQIQLDAIKEGMRRAVNVVEHNHLHSSKCLCASCVATNGDVEAILTAAEQLTEKNL